MGVTLHFDQGTLVVPCAPAAYAHEALRYDGRTGVWRAPAYTYRSIVTTWHARQLPYVDAARGFQARSLQSRKVIQPYPHQRSALEAWQHAQGRGMVVMPTGSGKTALALLAMGWVQQPTLVVVPTLTLLQQWHDILHEHWGETIGVLGGGSHDRQAITVATYDSAAQAIEFIGHCFGLLICDECHHLPASSYQFIAAGTLAPYRLGLTATLERMDGGEATGAQLLGPVCYRIAVSELEGQYLAPYTIRRIEVPMSPQEQTSYLSARQTYLSFLRSEHIQLNAPQGWAQFVIRSTQSQAGRQAMQAYRQQRHIALACEAKVDTLWQLLETHRKERTLVFADDNETVYRLSEQFLLPAITHHTKPAERRMVLDSFSSGDLPAVLTSRVLNEGIDVPRANIGIVLSGSGSVREHVQRLGRILRQHPGKHAILYEICSITQAERGISERRRQHQAFQYKPC